jgi:NAD(P)-dependent dehydrogenase (short-subunit alcohol dehydrogenase family)
MVRPDVAASVQDVDCSGTTALVTGATRGVGREIALALGRLGADVYVHGRDRERGEQVASRLRELGAESRFLRADFLDVQQVRNLAVRVDGRVDELDVLVNNAGAHFDDGGLTELGVERTFHANHLAPFLLTNELLDTIPDGGRIVTVASEVHRRASLDLDAVESLENYDGFDAYGRSKLANVLFTREFARRVDGPTANACHPGFVPGSGLWRTASVPVRALMALLSMVPRRLTFGAVDSTASAAATPTYLAVADVDADGAYFKDCQRVAPAEQATDDELAARLWEWSAVRVDR